MIELRPVDDTTYQVVDRQDLTDIETVAAPERRVHDYPLFRTVECRPIPRDAEAAAVAQWLRELNEAQQALEREVREELHETQKAWRGLPEETRRLFRRSSRAKVQLVCVDYREFRQEPEDAYTIENRVPRRTAMKEPWASVWYHVYLNPSLELMFTLATVLPCRDSGAAF